MRTPSGQIWMAWKSSPTGVWRTSKTHFSGLFFRPSKRGSSGGAGRLFLYLKKAKTTVFLGLKTTHYYLFHFLGYGYPPTPPGGSTEGGHFDPEWLAVRYALDLPPHPGGTPPDPLFGGIQTFQTLVELSFQIWPEGVLIVPHLDITTFLQLFQTFSSLQTECALHLSCVKVMGFRLRRDVALMASHQTMWYAPTLVLAFA